MSEMTFKWTLPYVKHLVNLETLSDDLRKIMISKFGGYSIVKDGVNYCHYARGCHEFEIDINYQIHVTSKCDDESERLKAFDVVKTLIRLQKFKTRRALREARGIQNVMAKFMMAMMFISWFSVIFLDSCSFMVAYAALIIFVGLFTVSSYIVMIYKKYSNDQD